MTPLIIYHGNCPDGWGSAFWLGRHLGKHEKLAAQHSDALTVDVFERDVYLVDFVYDDLETMRRIAETAESALILDHHKTAWKMMTDNETWFTVTDDATEAMTRVQSGDRFVALIQPEGGRSGIGLTARYVTTRWGTHWPDWFEHIEAWDVWEHDRQPFVREVYAAVTSYPQTEESWEKLLYKMAHDLVPEGRAVLRFRQMLIDDALNRAWFQQFDGYQVWVTTCPYAIGSEVAGELAKRTGTFGVYLVHYGNGVKVGLRSAGQIDVAEIAEYWGGGGHAPAAGFFLKDGDPTPFGVIL